LQEAGQCLWGLFGNGHFITGGGKFRGHRVGGVKWQPERSFIPVAFLHINRLKKKGEQGGGVSCWGEINGSPGNLINRITRRWKRASKKRFGRGKPGSIIKKKPKRGLDLNTRRGRGGEIPRGVDRGIDHPNPGDSL